MNKEAKDVILFMAVGVPLMILTIGGSLIAIIKIAQYFGFFLGHPPPDFY